MTKAFLLVTFILLCSLFNQVYSKELNFSGHNLPPYFFQTNNNAVKGAFVDTISIICERLRYKCSYTVRPVLRVENGIRYGLIDGWVVGFDASRDDFLIQPTPWFHMKLSFVGLTHHDIKLQNTNDISNFKIVIANGSTAMKIYEKKYAKQNPSFIKETSIKVMLKKLNAGRYGDNVLLFGPLPVLIQESKQLNIPLTEVLADSRYFLGVGFSKKSVSVDVADSFERELENMKRSGELSEIESKWLD